MSPLANQDPLAQLNDIIAPTAANWFPPAPIYWLILLLCSLLIAVTYYFVKQHSKQRKQQKLYLNKLTQLQADKASFIALNQLLKGCAISYFSRSEVASLHGEQWFDFLQRYSAKPIFADKASFVQRLYQSDVEAINEADYQMAKTWITALPKQIKRVNKDV